MKIINSKLFKILIVIFCIGIVLGIISFMFIDKSGLESNIINYINLIKNDEFHYISGLINSFISNFKYVFFIWSFGIIFIFSPLIPLLVVYRGISLSFMILSIIYTFHIKGLLYALILVFPTIIYEIILIFLSYYSINFAFKGINIIKENKDINLKSFIKNYFCIFIIFSIGILISSFIEIYISSNIIKFVV